MSVAIRVEQVSKKFRLGRNGDYSRLSETLQAPWQQLWQRLQPNTVQAEKSNSDERFAGEEFWALRDISFEVPRGEVFGIIGRNGAGKSTLLKILSRITRPTSGRICTRGRVGSLLEVGTGFHPELTGRENIFLNGSILGMSRREILNRFDEIVEFAEVSEFIDTPVKRYSSGMYTRLAFSVAAHLEPDILIIDEVLAVGDMQFQKKCLGKMQAVASHGRTVLFVSHNLAAVKQLCQKGLLLEGGKVAKSGELGDVVNSFLQNKEYFESPVRKWTQQNAPGTEMLKVLQVEVLPVFSNMLSIESGVLINVDIELQFMNKEIDCTLQLETGDGVVVFHQGVLLCESSQLIPGLYKVQASIPPRTINQGSYMLHLIFGENRSRLIFRLDNAMQFFVSNEGSHMGLQPKPGILALNLNMQCHFIASMHELN